MGNTFKSWVVANLEIVFIPILILIMISAGIFRELGPEKWGIIFVLSLFFVIIIFGSIKHGFASFCGWLAFIGFYYIVIKNEGTEDEVTESFKTVGIIFSQHVHYFLVTSLISLIGGILIAIYANRNFYEVVSRRFLYRNSNVEVFNEKWRYTFNRLFAGFMMFWGWFMESLLVYFWPS